MSEEGLRFNQGKARYDLIEQFAQKQKAQIFTKGAIKYSPNNWLKGMAWSKCYASALRHQAAWLRGEDYDIDPNCEGCRKSEASGKWECLNHTGELHSAMAAWNWDALTSYYKHYPQGDDRPHKYLSLPKIGLDIDEVICDFVKGWHEKWGADPAPEWWNYHRGMGKCFDEMRLDDSLDSFYLSLQPKIKPSDIPFEPACYVTSRPVDSSVTEKWLEVHGFPASKVYTIPVGASKVEVIKSTGIEIFVDDRFDNFTELNKAGICCFLFDAPHNKRYDVGYRRIKNLKELI